MVEKVAIPKVQDLHIGQLAVRGNWIAACVHSQMAWPIVTTEVPFRERTIFLIPWADAGASAGIMYPAAAVCLQPNEDRDLGQLLISHFLSSLAWVHGRSIEIEQWGGGNLPRSMGGFNGPYVVARDLIHPYVPDPADAKARLALGFYREGLGLNNPAYACLSFFKILNIFKDKGPDQVAWIDDTIPKITDSRRARDRISFLQKSNQTPGKYLYASNRCAVAHAFGTTANPEDPADMRRMRQDLPVAQALAEYAIEHHFGVKSSQTIWEEHLYELKGFTEIFGEGVVASIKAGGSPERNLWPPLPRLTVTLARSGGFAALTNLRSEIVAIADGCANVMCTSDDNLTAMMLRLNFAEERLQIDVKHGLRSGDDGSEGALRGLASVMRFTRDYYVRNGILEVWNWDQRTLLGRCDAFIPMNINLDATERTYDALINNYENEAELRSTSGKNDGP
ncbi:methylamine utilization protein MauJ [Rhizobium ruizarguesonis]